MIFLRALLIFGSFYGNLYEETSGMLVSDFECGDGNADPAAATKEELQALLRKMKSNKAGGGKS